MQINANYHTHTTFCDGTDTAEDMVRAAIALGFEHLGFSGHLDYFAHVDVPRYFAEILRLEEKYRADIEILCGIELDSLYDSRAAEGADYIIGSTHYLDLPPVDGEYISVDSRVENIHRLAELFFGGDYYRLTRAYYELEELAVERMHPTFIGHFDLVTRFNDLPKEQGGHFVDETDPRYLRPALEALEALIKTGTPIEINCGAINRGRKREPYPAPPLLKAIRELGGEVLLSADAHQKEKLSGGFDTALERARAAGFDHVLILTRDGSPPNTRPANDKLFWQEIPIL